MKATTALCLTIAGIASAIFYSRSAEPEATPAHAVALVAPRVTARKEPEAEPPSSPARRPYETASIARTPPKPSNPLEERSIVSTLRELGDSEPQRSLDLARDANARFPSSPDAPEREWYVCKSLVNLENFYEAREEARIMVAAYPGTPWALDVARHLLTNPLDLPGDPAP